jgi:hypothetical protein
MKLLHLVPLLAALLLSACGPSESELRSELREIDGELVAIQVAMTQHRSQMSQSEIDAFLGSFAAGYGSTTGDYGLAGEGISAASDALRQYDVSSYSLDQLQTRFLKLGKRRTIILSKLD